MISITFNFNFPSIKIAHEFGHQSLNRMLAINLVFMTVFISRSDGMLGKMMYAYVNTNGGVESIPQYRDQIKKIKSKARVQARKDTLYQMQLIEEERDRYYKDYIELKNQVSGLKNLAYQVRNIKAMTDEELNKIK